MLFVYLIVDRRLVQGLLLRLRSCIVLLLAVADGRGC